MKEQNSSSAIWVITTLRELLQTKKQVFAMRIQENQIGFTLKNIKIEAAFKMSEKNF